MKYATDMSAGIDLKCTEECVTIDPGGRVLIKTGAHVADILGDMEMDPPYVLEIQIRPRSGLAVRQGVQVHIGTVDADYPDEIQVLIFNHGHDTVKFQKGDRIAQAVVGIAVQPSHIPKGGQRNGGFGSTGR